MRMLNQPFMFDRCRSIIDHVDGYTREQVAVALQYMLLVRRDLFHPVGAPRRERGKAYHWWLAIKDYAMMSPNRQIFVDIMGESEYSDRKQPLVEGDSYGKSGETAGC